MVTTAYPVFVPHSVHISTIGLNVPDTHKLKSYGFGEALAPVSSASQAGRNLPGLAPAGNHLLSSLGYQRAKAGAPRGMCFLQVFALLV